MRRGKVVNRTWGSAGSASSSGFFLPDAEQDLVESGTTTGTQRHVVGNGGAVTVGGAGGDDDGDGDSEGWLGNTRLYAFPGLVVEVGEQGAVVAITVSLCG